MENYREKFEKHIKNSKFEKLDKKSNEIMFGKDSIPIIIPRYLVQDIDTIEDWKRAELMYKVLKESGEII